MNRLVPVLFLLVAGVCRGDEFPPPVNTEKDTQTPFPTPEASLAAFELPPGFYGTVFAAEPDVQNPIGLCWDGRGRLWIAENYTYAEAPVRFATSQRDRVLIFEDSDNDGKFDSRKVFTDDVQLLTSVAVGRGGVWLMCPPRLLFVPDADNNDVPDGPMQVVLDGFTFPEQNYHNFANGLKWGPDGWLYGRMGNSAPGLVGVPGTPDEQRTLISGGIWRYHPRLSRFETLCTGTVNPWGHDWNATGDCFFVDTVQSHFWQMIPGAHYVRNATLDPNPRVYELITHHADHWHYDRSGSWTKSRDGAANDYGGGHAHAGAMIYQADQWPAEYRGKLYTLNMHGRRMNQEIIEREGSGYVARHGRDQFLTSDVWFRGLELSAGPDGGVYVLDWSDLGECHENTGVHRSSGRIYKFVYGNPPAARVMNLRQSSPLELARLHRSTNEWEVRQARLALVEQFEQNEDISAAVGELQRLLEEPGSPELRTRAMYTLFQLNALPSDRLQALLNDPAEAVRVQSLKLLTDRWPLDDPRGPLSGTDGISTQVRSESAVLLPKLVAMAQTDPSGLVRLTLASIIQRLPVSSRAELARALVSRSEDRADHNLPLLVWYGLIPVADADPESLAAVAKVCTWPLTRRLIARRLAEDIERAPQGLNRLLEAAASAPDAERADVLAGISEGLRGWRKAPAPANWETVQPLLAASPEPRVRERVLELSVLFGDGRALGEVTEIALNAEADTVARKSALRTLIDSRPDDLRKTCKALLFDSHLQVLAAEGLATINDPEVARDLVAAYRKIRPANRGEIIGILVSRPGSARMLLNAIAAGQIPRKDLTAFHARQIQSLNDPEISALLKETWGELRDTPEEKIKLLAELKGLLTDNRLAAADLPRGRAVFSSICAKCHRLYGEGVNIGPDLTGSNRSNLDYLLENIVDPSAVVNKDFRMSIVVLDGGRVLNGVIVEQTDRTLTLQTQTDKTVVDKNEVEEILPTTLSPMPEGLLQALSPEQIVDLFAYLRYPAQVPLPEENATGGQP